MSSGRGALYAWSLDEADERELRRLRNELLDEATWAAKAYPPNIVAFLLRLVDRLRIARENAVAAESRRCAAIADELAGRFRNDSDTRVYQAAVLIAETIEAGDMPDAIDWPLELEVLELEASGDGDAAAPSPTRTRS